jgi:hypothetical protein
MTPGLLALCLCIFGLVREADAQEITNPATVRSREADSVATTREAEPRRVWQMPAIEVHGRRLLREEDRIGAYQQPRWTAHRRFTTTRIYVVPQGFFEFEYWLRPTFDRDGVIETEIQYEAEIGLPWRFQLDLYAVSHKQGEQGTLAQDEHKVELRWALANWGVIPTNPTLYLEWIGVSSASDHIEGKVLFGGELAPRWHWGTNLVFEHEMGGPQENSKEITAGVSYTVRDGVWSFGAETKLAFVDVKADRGNYDRAYQVGPSIQVYPIPRAHLDLVPLFDWRNDEAQLTAVFGWEF